LLKVKLSSLISRAAFPPAGTAGGRDYLFLKGLLDVEDCISEMEPVRSMG